MNLAQSSLPSEGHRLFLQLRSELHAVLCTRSRPTQPLLEPDWRSSSDLTCISSSTRTWDRAAGERDQRSGEIELAEKDRIEPFVPLTCCRGTTLCGGQSLLSPELHDHAPRGLLMTSKFDPDGLVKRRTLRPSQSGIGPARDLEGVAGQNSCFLRSQPHNTTGYGPRRYTARPRASLLRFLPSTKCQEKQPTPCKLVHQQLLLLQKHKHKHRDNKEKPFMTQTAAAQTTPHLAAWISAKRCQCVSSPTNSCRVLTCAMRTRPHLS